MSRRVVCANCGGRGHVFKNCSHPVISCGVICRNPSGEFLLVQRKDSFAFVEFVRGKYSLSDRAYLSGLFDGMTHRERGAVEVREFDGLWRMLWNGFSKMKTRPEYEDASQKFAKLKHGIRTDSGVVDLSGLLSSTRGRESAEWGFPKGRRALSTESDVGCALREMEEETGLRADQIRFDEAPGGGPVRFEETFTGTNGVQYHHVYFLARLVDAGAGIRRCDREIRQARWVKPDEVIGLISDAPTRVSLFKRLLCLLWSGGPAVVGKCAADARDAKRLIVNFAG